LQQHSELVTTRESAKGERFEHQTAEICHHDVALLAHLLAQLSLNQILYSYSLTCFPPSKYGDLRATIAAVLLDPEPRSVSLDAYPFKGGLREPLRKLMAVMRGMELKLAEGQPLAKLNDLDYKIGQMAHCFPTVFSFLLPEYVPPGGRPGKASHRSPEAMLMDMPKTGRLLFDMFVSHLMQGQQNLTC
jgi:hypothetical protein